MAYQLLYHKLLKSFGGLTIMEIESFEELMILRVVMLFRQN